MNAGGINSINNQENIQNMLAPSTAGNASVLN